MDGAIHRLLACPRCEGALNAALICEACQAVYEERDGVIDLRLPADSRTERVRAFYSQAPFPGYPPNDSIEWLRARAGRSRFAGLLDEAVAQDARIVEVGCGTGQMSLYLARGERMVIGADLCRASLELGAAAARRLGIDRVRFVETDLTRPGLRAGMFDVVYCSGVLHHTPDPLAAFSRVARLARPGGLIVLGLYNRYARLPHRLRRAIWRLTGERWIPGDPVLAERRDEPARREAWLRDQYRHPEEHRHSLAEVRGWFERKGISYLRAFPSALIGGADGSTLLAPEDDDWWLEGVLAQIGWMGSLGGEGGLFVVIGRVPDDVPDDRASSVTPELEECRT